MVTIIEGVGSAAMVDLVDWVVQSDKIIFFQSSGGRRMFGLPSRRSALLPN